MTDHLNDRFYEARRRHMEQLDPEVQERIRTWLRLGNENLWIVHAYDPPFTELCFHICADFRELADELLHGNWCLGQAFALDDICFINQVDGGDEWLTIKGSTAFESITMHSPSESREQAAGRLARTIEQIRNATELQCKRLEYPHPYEETTPEDGELAIEDSEGGEPQLVLHTQAQFEGGRQEQRRFVLRARPDDDIRILKNENARFVISVNRQGDVLLEYFRTKPEASQVAAISASDIEERLGANFHDLTSLEQLHCLLPHLAST